MESSRVMCPHCDGWFFPEEGVTLDDCPKCGRTVEVKPAPAPLPEDVEPLRAALDKLRCGYKRLASSYNYLARWTADEATKSEHQIDDLTRRLAEAELEACESMAGAHAEQEVSRHWKQEAEYQNARVRELEATIDAMAEAHAHDDQALTAAYLSGAHAGKKQAEAERDALLEALIQIDHHASQNRVWAGVDGWKYAGLSNVAQKKIHGITQAALATEVKP